MSGYIKDGKVTEKCLSCHQASSISPFQDYGCTIATGNGIHSKSEAHRECLRAELKAGHRSIQPRIADKSLGLEAAITAMTFNIRIIEGEDHDALMAQ